MDSLSQTTGVVALAAAALAFVAFVIALINFRQLARLRAKQTIVLGESGERDLLAHGAELERSFATLRDYVGGVTDGLGERLDGVEQHLHNAFTYRALVRYDAYNEMSGHQSLSIALLDDSRSGIILSSIHHRDQARLYAKQVHEGQCDLELSPEEDEALRRALADG